MTIPRDGGPGFALRPSPGEMHLMSPSNWQELAIVTGVPSFTEMLHVGRPNVGDEGRLLARTGDMLDRRYFTNNGPFVQELEEKIADYVGVRRCVVMCNATIALEIAIRA